MIYSIGVVSYEIKTLNHWSCMIGLRHVVTNKKTVELVFHNTCVFGNPLPSGSVVVCPDLRWLHVAECTLKRRNIYMEWATLKIRFIDVIFINRNRTNHQHRHLVSLILKYFRVFCGSVTLKEQVYCDIYKWNLLSQTGSVTRESFSLVINFWFNHLNQYYVPDMTRVLVIPPGSGVT